MTYVTALMIYMFISADFAKNSRSHLPCSPIPFIYQESYAGNNLKNFLDKPIYKNIGYDYDDTINTHLSGAGVKIQTINQEIKQKIIKDFMLDRRVFIISNRNRGDTYLVMGFLRRNFGADYSKKIKIILLGGSNQKKFNHIKSNNIDVFYGDSDSDIQNAIIGGAIPVRVLRNKRSTDKLGVHIGKFGEYFLTCSQK
ncbi:hypothetical protein WKH32_04140 [Pantoea agglomerans]|uniref:hypothetical protein n=1 Tax=Enterobacter agglomerans TaxID=549 RepID=UPI003C7A8E9F